MMGRKSKNDARKARLEQIDPNGLIRESYRIAGIGAPECRSIFLDWALRLPPEVDQAGALADLVRLCAEGAPDHPMSDILREARGAPARPVDRRRGGRAARRAR